MPERMLAVLVGLGALLCSWPVSAQSVVSGNSAPRAVWISGELVAGNAQVLTVPPSDSSPVVLRTFVADGERVRKGDVVLRIDAAQAAQRAAELGSTRASAAATLAKDLAVLEVARIDAELESVRADAALARAKLDAGIPREHVSALDFDRYRGELERATREAELRQNASAQALAARERRREDGRLELEKIDTELAYLQTQVSAAEVQAEMDGVLVHGFDSNSGMRYEEGSSGYPGQRVGEIIASGPRRVRAYALQTDRAAFQPGQTVTVSFDALGGARSAGTVSSISGAPQPRLEWGDGRYFVLEIELSDTHETEALPPGASARVGSQAPTAQPQDRTTPTRAPLELPGELISLRNIMVAPPSIANVWTLTLTQLAPDGSPVKQGTPLAAFDGSEVMAQLQHKQSTLKEKQSERDRLALELAERARNERIVTAEQVAKVDKSRRKASQPESLLPALQYRKLVADRRLAESELELVRAREQASAQQRVAETELVDVTVQTLEREVSELQAGMAAMNLLAPSDGIFMHKTNFRGEKFDVGSQVFRGQSFATIPDIQQIAVRAAAPEAELSRIHVGDAVRVEIQGSSTPALEGRVVALGRVVRSKSRLQPVPVIDVDIELQSVPPSLRPGQAVRVRWLAATGDAR